MNYILNIETATKICSVSLALDGVLVDCIETTEGNAHASKLAVFIDQLVHNNGINYYDLKAIAISQGPGSYTGLRIGTSTAKGLCYALDKPLIAINTLESMAYHAKENYTNGFNGIFQPMIDARRMEVYTQSFSSELEILNNIEAKIIDQESFSGVAEDKPILIFGDGASKCKEVISAKNVIFSDDTEASSKGMISLSHKAFLNNDFADVAYFEPFYLKEFNAVVSKVKGLE